MLPKSSKHFIQPTADQLDQDVGLIEDVIGFFYQELRRDLVEMKHPNIQVRNLGSFKAIPNELPKLIAKYQTHLNSLGKDTFKKMGTRKDLERKLEKVISLQMQIKKEAKRRAEFYRKKNGEL